MAKGSSAATQSRDSAAVPEPSGRQGPREVVIPVQDPDNPTDSEIERALAVRYPDLADLSRDERDRFVRLAVAQQKRPSAVRVKLQQDGPRTWKLVLGDGERKQLLLAVKLQESFGTKSMDFVNARANELIAFLGALGKLRDVDYNAFIAFVSEMQPRDPAEAMLLTQTYVAHVSAMSSLRQFHDADQIEHAQLLGNLATKFLRISTGNMESLARIRRDGVQVVKHITIDNRGGQAVVAENIHTGGRNARRPKQPYGPNECGAALLGEDPPGDGVPIAGDEGEEALSHPRRRSGIRRTEGE